MSYIQTSVVKKGRNFFSCVFTVFPRYVRQVVALDGSYRSAHYVNVILLFLFLDRFSPVLGQSSESSPSPKIVSALEKFCARNFVSIEVKLH